MKVVHSPRLTGLEKLDKEMDLKVKLYYEKRKQEAEKDFTKIVINTTKSFSNE